MKVGWVRELSKDDAITTWQQACELFSNKYHCPHFICGSISLLSCDY